MGIGAGAEVGDGVVDGVEGGVFSWRGVVSYGSRDWLCGWGSAISIRVCTSLKKQILVVSNCVITLFGVTG